MLFFLVIILILVLFCFVRVGILSISENENKYFLKGPSKMLIWLLKNFYCILGSIKIAFVSQDWPQNEKTKLDKKDNLFRNSEDLNQRKNLNGDV